MAARETLARYAARILSARDEALESVCKDAGARRELLRRGRGPHGSLRVAPPLLRAFLADHPATGVRLVTAGDPGLLRDARAGILDVILMSLPVNDSELVEEPLWSYEMVLIFPPTAKRGGRKPSLASLGPEPFIPYRRTVVIDSAFRRLCADLGFEPNAVMENDEPDSIRELVKLGLGVSFLPRWSAGEDVRRGTVQVLRPLRPQVYNYGQLHRRADFEPAVLSGLRTVAHAWRKWWPLAPYVNPPLG